MKLNILYITLLLSLINVVYAESCPTTSVSCRANTTNQGSYANNSLKVNGMVNGEIIETSNKLIIKNATFNLKNTDKSAINLSSKNNKRVVFSNVTIVSDGVRKNTNKNSSSILSIMTSSSNSKVVLDSVRVRAHNSNLSVTSNKSQVCAAITCLQLSGSLSSRNVNVRSSGNTKLNATRTK